MGENQSPPFRPSVPDTHNETNDLVQLMFDCWTEKPNDRPDFNTIKKRFANMNAGKYAVMFRGISFDINHIISLFKNQVLYNNDVSEYGKQLTMLYSLLIGNVTEIRQSTINIVLIYLIQINTSKRTNLVLNSIYQTFDFLFTWRLASSCHRPT